MPAAIRLSLHTTAPLSTFAISISCKRVYHRPVHRTEPRQISATSRTPRRSVIADNEEIRKCQSYLPSVDFASSTWLSDASNRLSICYLATWRAQMACSRQSLLTRILRYACSRLRLRLARSLSWVRRPSQRHQEMALVLLLHLHY